MAQIILILFLTFNFASEEKSNKAYYVTYKTKGFEGREKFTVYVRDTGNTAYYYGFEIAHELDTSALVNTDQFRLQRANIYRFNGVAMAATGLKALANGESECVYRSKDAIDFTGGWHGDEKLVDVAFYMDEKLLSGEELSSSFTLRPCREFSYRQASKMFRTAREGETSKLKPVIEARHVKRSVFRNSGYESQNKISWELNGTIAIGYMSISCIATDIGEFCQSDTSEVYTLDRSGDRKISDVNHKAYVWNITNGTSAFVKSEFNFNNDSAIQFIWDVSNYSKYYRNLVYGTPIEVKAGNIWSSDTLVMFKMDGSQPTDQLLIKNNIKD